MAKFQENGNNRKVINSEPREIYINKSNFSREIAKLREFETLKDTPTLWK